MEPFSILGISNTSINFVNTVWCSIFLYYQLVISKSNSLVWPELKAKLLFIDS